MAIYVRCSDCKFLAGPCDHVKDLITPRLLHKEAHPNHHMYFTNLQRVAANATAQTFCANCGCKADEHEAQQDGGSVCWGKQGTCRCIGFIPREIAAAKVEY